MNEKDWPKLWQRKVLWIFALLCGLSCWRFPVTDPDLGWHLLGGEYIYVHGIPPSADFINSLNGGWHDYHWLFQLGLYCIFRLGGFVGVQVATGLLLSLCALVMLRVATHSVQDPKNWPPIFLAFSLGWALLLQVQAIRPQAVSLALLAVVLLILMPPRRPGELGALFVLAVLLANIHVYWPFVPVLWVIFRVVPHLQDRYRYPAAYIWGGLILLGMAGLVSPYSLLGIGNSFLWINYALLYDYLLQPESLRHAIGELRETFAVGGIPPLIVCLLVAITAAGIDFHTIKNRTPIVLSWLVGLILAIRSYKFVALLALFGLPLTVCVLESLLARCRCTGETKKCFGIAHIALIGCAAGAFFLTVWFAPPFNSKSRELSWLPMKACQQLAALNLQSSHGRDHVRVMTHFNQGAWCRFAIHQADPRVDIRVTTDSRTQWVPPQRFREGFDAYSLKPGWETTIAQWSPDAILVYNIQPLGQMLIRMPSLWRLTYSDKDYSIFLPMPSAS